MVLGSRVGLGVERILPGPEEEMQELTKAIGSAGELGKRSKGTPFLLQLRASFSSTGLGSPVRLNIALTMHLAQSRCSANVLAMHMSSCVEPGHRKCCQDSCTQSWSCRGAYFGPRVISCLRDEENGLASKAGKLFLAPCKPGFSSASSETLLCVFPFE